jgi:hypothetical protein
VPPRFGDREVFALGARLARERLAELGLSELLPHERAFVGVTSTQPAWGGFHCPNPVPGGLPPGYRYVQAAAVVTRYGDLHGDVPSAPGVAGLDLIRTYTHDCFHWGTFRSYRLGNTGIHRNQHGINFRRENGSSYSAPDPQGSASTRNLGIIMEGAFDRDSVPDDRSGSLRLARQHRRHASRLRGRRSLADRHERLCRIGHGSLHRVPG